MSLNVTYNLQSFMFPQWVIDAKSADRHLKKSAQHVYAVLFLT